MKLIFNLIFVILILIVLAPLILLIGIAVGITSKGPIIYWSRRVGRDNKIFKMPKFRSMRKNSPEVATHLLKNPDKFLSPIGGFLRKSSLDELPQLFSVLKGDMSFVGPRPALFNQFDLIRLRTEKGVSSLLPGITGWAQINGRDDLTIQEKVALDLEYLNNQSLLFDIKVLWLTVIKIIKNDDVSH